MYELTPATFWFVGLDLGQRRDYAALVACEKLAAPTGATYHCRHVERAPLGTSYVALVASVATFLGKTFPEENYQCAFDLGGVGAPIRDLFAKELPRGHLQPILSISEGDAHWGPGRARHVPKKDILDNLLLVAQQRRLKVSPALRHAATLKRELQSFTRRHTESGRTVFNVEGGEKGHGDLVSALALAVYWGEAYSPPGIR